MVRGPGHRRRDQRSPDRRVSAAALAQERMHLRRMADASLALAERRADDLKKATERLGMEAPTTRQLRGLQLLGLLVPPASAGAVARIRGVLLIILLIVLVLALGFGIIYGIGQAAGGISVQLSVFYGFLLVLVALGVLGFVGRRRQRRMKAERAEQVAARSG